ncbi:Similar to Altered inheritance of mitochondria protein 9, mitochondrial; acc. no. C5DBS6 [Pyronema omphalodes CBS 100304]|uniref:Similar to Altered inheritance of mitochondria protein 9, mitochondrial acc. no. C5DBS6 n=1 Tax=Pyronema omphalodes (strain CBS 100304) TaxID=1076935 RepID=U4LKN1_PYROM|nr:Similar to Altered inheritance of mitochondria protein 9, mitochondrial; acc. no. C5DBS6 [Pyronema omphalodes CBS 100304]
MSTANTSNNTDSAIGAPVSATLPTLSRQDRDDSRPQQYPSPSSPHATSATSPPIPTPSPRNGRAGYQLSLPIPRLQRSEWVNLEGLVECALSSLGKDECTGISELGRGSHNSLYEIRFSDGTSCAASISNSPRQFFSADAKRSEIATMQYIHSSKLYKIPIPKIYSWDLTFDNKVGAPYILRECVKGKNLSEDGRFYRLNARDKQKVVKELAHVQAELSKPSEFTQLGYIYRQEGENGQFYVGKMATVPSGSDEEDKMRESFMGPYDSLTELWEARIERETLCAIGNWSQLPSDASLPSMLPPAKANPQQFGELQQLLSGLTNLFTPPEQLSKLCIHHSDLAIRNVLFDEKTLKITGVIDWEFASVMPLVITGRFPNDLGWEGNEFARSLGKFGNVSDGGVWNHHYYDWTSLSGVQPPPRADMPSPPASPTHSPASIDYLTTPNATANGYLFEHQASVLEDFDNSEGRAPSPPSPPLPPPPTSETSQQDLTSRATNLVELYYYRKFYASKLAARNFNLTRLFIDAVAYIKFNEIVLGGPEKWFASADWIKEVYWRMQEEDESAREDLMEGKGVVKVPEVFLAVRRREVDLGKWENKVMSMR